MMFDILKAINPLVTRENVICQNDGNGEYIAKWDASLGPQPTQAQMDAAMPAVMMAIQEKELTIAVQEILDIGAKILEYDNMNSLCSYANSTDAVFGAQGLTAVAWRDAVWVYCRSVRSAVLAGGQMPTKEQLIAGLPVRPW